MFIKSLVLGTVSVLAIAGSSLAGEVSVFNRHATGNFKVTGVSRTVSNEVYAGVEKTYSGATKFEVLDNNGSFATSFTRQKTGEAFMGQSQTRSVTRQSGYISTYEHSVGASH